MAHVLLFPSEMKTKAGGEGKACVKSWRDDGLSSFSISRLEVFYGPITLDDMLVCVKAAGHKKEGVGSLYN